MDKTFVQDILCFILFHSLHTLAHSFDKIHGKANNEAMKRILFLIGGLFWTISLFAGIAPVSSAIGTVAVSIKPNSPEELVQKAFSSEFTEDWLTTYALESEPFAVAYSETLSQLLPLESFLLSVYDGNQVSVLPLSTGKVITVIIKEGRISALSLDD